MCHKHFGLKPTSLSELDCKLPEYVWIAGGTLFEKTCILQNVTFTQDPGKRRRKTNLAGRRHSRE